MAGAPGIGNLYAKMTRDGPSDATKAPVAMEILGKLSVTSQFKLSLHLSRSTNSADKLLNHLSQTGVLGNNEYAASNFDFLCSDASIPGLSFNSTQEQGSRQGIIESFPQYRVFPPLEVTFYVDNEFKVIRLFEEWMNFINPLYNFRTGLVGASSIGSGTQLDRPSFYRLRYPDDYKRIITISKFERNFIKAGTNEAGATPTVSYRLIDAYPENVNSIPVTYEGSAITKTTVRFLYSRYVMEYSNVGANNDIISL